MTWIFRNTRFEYIRVRVHGSSVSTEYGIGLPKKPYLTYTRSEADIEWMRGIRAVFDPLNILNLGKLLG